MGIRTLERGRAYAPGRHLLELALAIGIAIAAAPGVASAATITSDGPLTQVIVGPQLNCQILAGDASGEFFGGDSGACATAVAVPQGGQKTVYGPPSLPAGPALEPFTAISQETDTTASPRSVTTTVGIAGNLTLNEVDSYRPGDLFYTTDITLKNTGSAIPGVVIYHGGDCYFGNADVGYGAEAASEEIRGAHDVACTKVPNDTPPGGALRLASLTPGNNWFEGGFSANWQQIVGGAPLPDTCDCKESEDNGASLSWSVDVPAGTTARPGTVTVSLKTAIDAGQPTAVTDRPTGSPGDSSATIAGTVSANGRPTTYYFEYGQDPQLAGASKTAVTNLPSSGFSNDQVTADLIDRAAGTWYYRVVASNDLGDSTGEIRSFTIGPPGAVTDDAFSTGTSTATFAGSVTPNGKSTAYWFEYSTDSFQTFTATAHSDAQGTGFDSQSVQVDVAGLTQGTTYQYRLVAQNGFGTTTADPLSFVFERQPTAPTSATGGSGAVAVTSATVDGSVSPNGAATTWWFEYGLDGTYGSSTPHQDASGTAFEPQTVSASLTGLAPGTTYHYRLVSVNDYAAGPVAGEDRTFTTSPPTDVNPPPDAGPPVVPPGPPDVPPADPELPPPAIGKTANAVPEQGKVFVKLPAGTTAKRAKQLGLAGATQRFIPLEQATQVPMGSTFQTMQGTLGLSTASEKNGGESTVQKGFFSQGQFVVQQSKKSPLTTLSMNGGDLGKCGTPVPKGGAPKASAARTRSRRLFSSVKGRFRTRGRNSSATVRGTQWTMTDTCAGTRTTVKQGTVVVRDFRLKKDHVVTAGKSYFAKAPNKKGKRHFGH